MNKVKKINSIPLLFPHFLWISALILSACGIWGPNSNNSAVEESIPVVEGPGVPKDSAAPNIDLEIGDLPQLSPTEEPKKVYKLGFSLGDTQLKATDPNIVSLASGKIQFIEFFAYW